MKKIISFFIGIFFITSILQAEVVLKDTPFRYDILNQVIHMPKDTMTFKKILQTLEVQTSYNIYNFVNEIPNNRLYTNLQSFKRVGNLLKYLISGYSALIKVSDKKYSISFVYPTEIYIDLPMGWDMNKAKQDYERKFTYVDFYVAGNRLTAKGLKADLRAVAKSFANYQNQAYKKLDLNVEIYPFCTKVNEQMFIARRKAIGSEMYKPLYQFSTSVGQGDKIVVVYNKMNLNFIYDATNHTISDGKIVIPVKDLNNIGVAITAKNKIKTGLFSYKTCSHIIITFNKVNLLRF